MYHDPRTLLALLMMEVMISELQYRIVKVVEFKYWTDPTFRYMMDNQIPVSFTVAGVEVIIIGHLIQVEVLI